MSFIRQKFLSYADHDEEIASLNFILAQIQSSGTRPDLSEAVAHILKRLDQLQQHSKATLRDYDQFEVHQ